MEVIENWAEKWGIAPPAIADLRIMLGAIRTDPESKASPGTETDVQNRKRIQASEQGGRLWRNNSGVAIDPETRRPVRFGLCNDSARINGRVKSSDLIGITPKRVTPEMVHKVVGIFTAIECKKPGWKYTGVAKERAQLRFLEMVISMGGIAYFER